MTTDHKPGGNPMRDARLAKALQHMPDAHMQASAQARAAVLRAAQEAIDKKPITPPAAQSHWWNNMWAYIAGSSGNRMPWNAALATVLVAGFVTVLWQGKEVPDAKPDSEKTSEIAAIAPLPVPAPTPVATAVATPAAASPLDNLSAPVPTAPAQRASAVAPSSKVVAKGLAKEAAPQAMAKRDDSAATVVEKQEMANKSESVSTSAATPPAMAEAMAPVNKKAQREAPRHKDAASASFAKPPGLVAQIPTVRIQFEGQDKIVNAENAEALLQNLRNLTRNTTYKNDTITEGTAHATVGSDFKVSLQGEKEVWTYDVKTNKLFVREYLGESSGFKSGSVQINATQYAQLRSLMLALQGE